MAIIQGTSKAAGGAGYEIDQSIRFNKTDNSGLTVTPSAGNRDLFTLSVWFKLGLVTSTEFRTLFCADTSNTFQITFLPTANGDYLRFQDNGVVIFDFSQSLRDPSAWYHLVYAYDSAQATAADRCTAYLNGEEVTALTGVAYPAQNVDSKWNSAVVHGLGYRSATDNWDGYLAEIHHIEGTALDPTSFGEYNDDGVWIPKRYSGAYGTNGFYITGATASDLGEDFSGNNNDFTSGGLATTDQMLDTPTNNFWTLNPTDPYSSNISLSEGNLRAVMGAATTGSVFGPMLPETGKWAWKITATLNRGSASEYPVLGIVPSNNADLSGPMRAGGTGEGYGADGRFFSASAGSNSAYGATWADGDVIEVGWDADNGTLSFWHNGSAQGVAVTGLTGRWKPAQDHFTTAGGDTLSDFGQSGYTPTDSSYKTLCTANLATPSITDGSAHFQPTLYTGTGSSQAVSQSGNSTFQPDWVWIKGRSGATEHVLTDAVRGVTKELSSNDTGAEETVAQGLTTFGSAGFTVGTDGSYNTSSATYAGWQWKANGAGSSNTDGDITSTVSANTTAGFSIATYTGNASSSQTIGHGLGQIPSLVMFKELDSSSYSWQVYHASLGYTQRLILDATNAAVSATNIFSAAPTSTVFTIGNSAGINTNSASHVMYSFAEIPGYSSFGSYTGNGSADGPFVYTGGFKPAFVLIKRTNAAENWLMMDSTRYPNNPANNPIFANTTNADANGGRPTDFLSNGFKPRNTLAGMNASGSTYIYMAFAENPFGGDGAAPATAR